MVYLIADSFSKQYFVHKCTSSFCFLFIFYASIFIGPFFLAKQSGDYWTLNKSYYEQPHVNFRGSYILSCYHGSGQKIYTNIDPLNDINDDSFRPQLYIQKNDTNSDKKFDYFSVTLSLQLKETENTADLKQCQVFLLADYGLRDQVRLQMISPLHFKIDSNNGIKNALIQGDIKFFQKNPLLSQSVVRTLYNNVYNYLDIQENTLEGYLTEYIARNESLYSNYNTYIVPGNQQLGEKVDIQIDLQVPLTQQIQYTPPLLENLKFLWVQYICILIPIFWVSQFVINFILQNKIFSSIVTTNLPLNKIQSKIY